MFVVPQPQKFISSVGALIRAANAFSYVVLECISGAFLDHVAPGRSLDILCVVVSTNMSALTGLRQNYSVFLSKRAGARRRPRAALAPSLQMDAQQRIPAILCCLLFKTVFGAKIPKPLQSCPNPPKPFQGSSPEGGRKPVRGEGRAPFSPHPAVTHACGRPPL
jgi:hypothetical protein